MHIVTDQEICTVSKDSTVTWYKQIYWSAAAAFTACCNYRIYFCHSKCTPVLHIFFQLCFL